MTLVRQCAAVRRQCASELVKVSAPVRQCAYKAHTGAHTPAPNHKDSARVRQSDRPTSKGGAITPAVPTTSPPKGMP
jgi:hypothetical protein